MINNPNHLLAIFLGIILLSVWLDTKYAWARKISPVLMIISLAGFVSNIGLITDSSPFYEELAGFTVPFAVCLILFTVNLKDLRRFGATLLAAFGVACVGTIIGVMTAGLLLNPELVKVLGAESWKLAGPFVGTYTGGSLNFFAMWEGLEIGNPDLFAAANAVDNLTIFPLFAVWILVPAWLGRFYPSSPFWGAVDGNAESADIEITKPELRILDVVALTFAAVTVMVLSDLIKTHLIAPVVPSFPTILIVTTLALILAQFRFMGRLQGAFELGNLAFFLFFCAVGAMINVKMAIVLSPILFAYVMIMATVHLVFIYGVGRLFRLDIRVLTIASCAAKSGPPTVVALANVHGWKNLVLPGVAMGLLGYAVGNYLGFAAAYAMKALLGQ
ncbi:MAG: hypothetical protein DRJ61_02910 [Acidobacteria bacterium]|nr:MAG: hypothetical protein DRJ65_09545 [Acidobacteriota bacterium]RLE35567.1 MAG: hypothetical protein DRJ61_02910 [Acidobacteriota bacterium]